jgi:hypothetical protein
MQKMAPDGSQALVIVNDSSRGFLLIPWLFMSKAGLPTHFCKHFSSIFVNFFWLAMVDFLANIGRHWLTIG